MTELTDLQKSRIFNINATVSAVAFVGGIAGIIYAKKTGGGFWRYIGYWIAGSAIVGLPAKIIATPFTNKILKEAEQK
jgi:hypothetical protein